MLLIQLENWMFLGMNHIGIGYSWIDFGFAQGLAHNSLNHLEKLQVEPRWFWGRCDKSKKIPEVNKNINSIFVHSLTHEALKIVTKY